MLLRPIKKAIVGIALLSAPLLLSTACDKEEPGITAEPVSYTFNQDNLGEVFQVVDGQPTFENIKASAADPKVSEVWLITEGRWRNFSAKNISDLINIALRPATEISPKVNGGGSNWEFTPGAATKADSLWLVQNNWTVNKHLTR